jgi:hypothetical protein
MVRHRVTLRPDWYARSTVPGVLENEPGIYEWNIEGVGRYIGRYSNISRPRSEYALNVSRLLAGLSYRKSKEGGFRRIHCALAAAYLAGTQITLTILENQPLGEAIKRRETELIRQRGTLNGRA